MVGFLNIILGLLSQIISNLTFWHTTWTFSRIGKNGRRKWGIFSTCPRYRSLETVRNTPENERLEKKREFCSSSNSLFFFFCFQYWTTGGLLSTTLKQQLKTKPNIYIHTALYWDKWKNSYQSALFLSLCLFCYKRKLSTYSASNWLGVIISATGTTLSL